MKNIPVYVSDLLLLDLPLREPPRGHPLPVGAEALDLAVVGPVRDLQPDVQLLGPGRRRGEGEVAAADERAAARADRQAGVVHNHHAQLEHLQQGSRGYNDGNSTLHSISTPNMISTIYPYPYPYIYPIY